MTLAPANTHGRAADRLRTAECASLFALAAFFCAWLNARDNFIGNIADSAVYLAVAEAFSPWRDGNLALGFDLFRDFAFPPMFPLLLALGGGGADAPRWSYALAALLQAAAVTAVYAWLRVEQMRAGRAVSVALLYLIAPATLLSTFDIQSEALYVALCFSAFAVIRRAQARDEAVTLALGALLLGIAALTRSVGLTALVAALVTLRRAAWCAPWPALFALMPLIAWQLVREALRAEASYLDVLDRGSLGDTLEQAWTQIGINAEALLHAAPRVFDLTPAAGTAWIVGTCAALATVGCLIRVRAARMDALYVLLYLALMLVWPYPNHMRRFLGVLLPLFLFHAMVGVAVLCPRVRWREVLTVAMLGSLAVVTLPSTLVMLAPVAASVQTPAARYVRVPQWQMSFAREVSAQNLRRIEDVTAAMRDIATQVPSSACVSSALQPYIPLYAKRRAQRLAGATRPIAEFEASLARCPYVFMAAVEQWPPSDYPPMYPYSRVRGRIDIVDVRLWEAGATKGTVLTMLGRIHDANSASASVRAPR